VTGTVTGVRAHQRYASDRWRVMSPNHSTISSTHRCATGSKRAAGPYCLADVSTSDSERWDMKPSSRSWWSGERSRG
jgi:hypothetical protein